MARRVFTEKDQARVAVLLQANNGNVKKTAREAGLAPATVRDWRNKWNLQGGLPPAVEEAIPAATEGLVADLKEVVSLAIVNVKDKLREGKVSAKDAAWISGVFIDKIRIIEGQATTRTETVHALPGVDEARELMRGFLAEIVEAADNRQAAISDAGLGQPEVIEAEHYELIPASDQEE